MPINLFVTSVKQEMTIEPKKREPKKKYTECLKKDLEWGEKKELEVKKQLETYWRCELIKTSKTHPLDFVSLSKCYGLNTKVVKIPKTNTPQR